VGLAVPRAGGRLRGRAYARSGRGVLGCSCRQQRRGGAAARRRLSGAPAAAQARNLAVMPGYDTLEVGTEEVEAVGAVGAAQEVLLPEGRAALLQFPRCHVSAAASQLAALAAAALHEAVDSGGRREAVRAPTGVCPNEFADTRVLSVPPTLQVATY